jgi:hypothetical protein
MEYPWHHEFLPDGTVRYAYRRNPAPLGVRQGIGSQQLRVLVEFIYWLERGHLFADAMFCQRN